MTAEEVTSRQEQFIRGILGGLTQREAYLKAFGAKPNALKSTIDETASRIANKPEVAARVAELRERMANKLLWSREQSLNALLDAYKLAREEKQPAAMTGAIKEINAMFGYNAPSKVELSGEVTLAVTKIERIIVDVDSTN